jgi:hypothetical protein
MKTFKEFLELCESSSGESGRRLLASRGPEQSRSERRKQQQDKSNRAALSKAGFSHEELNGQKLLPQPITEQKRQLMQINLIMQHQRLETQDLKEKTNNPKST